MEIAKFYPSDLRQNYIRNNFNELAPINMKVSGSEIRKEFLFQKDVAAWFRGTSHLHIKGANRLLNALRDDGEQETTHRVRTCLNLIGLKPMITFKEIKFLMHLSRGNDLVFLWFLMEKHYRTPKVIKPYSYSHNEQLICSAICHLDMVTTLRELDKILPKSHITRGENKKKCSKRQEFKEAHPKTKINKQFSQQFVLPYFTKYNQPQNYGKRLFLEQPNFIVHFKYYRHYNNPNYVVQNEFSRWYANYHFSPVKRIVHITIREIIKNIFYSSEIVSLKAKSNDILCDHKKSSVKKSKEECSKHCQAGGGMEQNRSSKVKPNLANDFGNQTRPAKQHAVKGITSDSKVFDTVLGEGAFSNDDYNTTTNCKLFTKKKINPSTEQYICNDLQRYKHCKSNIRIYKEKFQIAQNSIQKNNTNPERLRQRNSSERLLTSSDVFFKFPSVCQSYKLDYHKIFANKETDFRKIIIKALSEKTSSLSMNNKYSQVSYGDAVKKCIRKTFEKEVKKHETAHIDETTAQQSGSSNSLKQFNYSASYNAADFYIMDQMLFEAFQHLRKNPKFVWAQLPDAHKVPFLREWIAHRFGKQYTPTERAKSYRRSCLVFRALEKSERKFSGPNTTKIGKNFFVEYNCRKQLGRKVQQIKRNYYQKLDSHLLEYTRAFWFAMRGYICSNGPPRKSFYAYMPSRLQDIQHFRLWKSSDYRNNWIAWNIRHKEGV